MPAKDTYKVVFKRQTSEIVTSEALDQNHWFGYITKGGNICILICCGPDQYGFCSRENKPAFVAISRGRALCEALSAGRDIRSSHSLQALIAELLHVGHN